MDKLVTSNLSRLAGLPLHRQITDELRRQISAGELLAGELLPSESVLTRRFGVSRGTVRQALAGLRADGTISGSQGRPLAVRSANLTQPLSEVVSFSAWARSLGKAPSGVVIEFGRQAAGGHLAGILGLTPGSSIYQLIRLRLADGEPLMIERTAFPPSVGELVERVDLERDSIYASLAVQGVIFASARHLIGVLLASRSDARWLRVPFRSALVRVQRQAFSLSGEPLEWSDDRYLGRVQFALESTAATSGLARRLE